MRDFSPLIIGVLALVTAVVALLWCLGRSSRRVPVCRACGRDVRTFAWREPCVCDCGAPLMRRHAVRGQRRRDVPALRRRSRGVAAIAATLFAATVLFTWWATHVRAGGIGWMDILPTRIYAFALARGWDDPEHASASRRLAELPPLDEVAMLRDAAVDLWSTESPRGKETWRLAMKTATIAIPTGEDGARFITAATENIRVDAIQQPEGIAVEFLPIDDYCTAIRSLMIRVDEVRLGDRAVPFHIVLHEQRRRQEEAERSAPRFWYPLSGLDGFGALRLLIPGESIDGVGPEAVRVVGATAYGSDLLASLLDDDLIATSRDPATWGVPVASGPINRLAAAPLPAWAPFTPGAWPPERWLDPPGHQAMPALVAGPLVTIALCGALAGVLLVLAVAGAICAWHGPMRLSPPICRGCDAVLRGQRETLPACCPECGRAVESIDDCRCTVRHRRWALAIIVVVGVAAAGFWLMPRAHRAIDSQTQLLMPSPRAEAAWLVRATIEARSSNMQYAAGDRLKHGALHSSTMYGWLDNAAANRAAARELLAWWRETGGTLPPSLTDPDTRQRRRQLASFLQEAVANGAVSAAEARPIAAWCVDVACDPPSIILPRVVRVGEAIQTLPLYMNASDELIAIGENPRSWRWAHSLGLITPEQPGTLDVEVTWSRPVLPSIETRHQFLFEGPRPGGPAPAGDPLFEQVLRERVRVLDPDAPSALTGDALAELIPTIELALHVREGGSRSAARLAELPRTWTYLRWQGRWEVLISDAADAEPCVVMRDRPSKRYPAALGALPSPLPEALLLRFVPELHESSFSSRAGASGFLCGETVTFRLRRSGEEDHDSSRVMVYRTALPE